MNTFTFDEIKEGMEASFQRKISLDDVSRFSEITGDKNPLHMDETYASESQFKQRVVFGLLIESFFSTIVGMYLPGKYALILSVESKFKKPTYINDILTFKGVVLKKHDFGNMISVKTTAENQKGEVVVEGKINVKVLK